MYPSVGSKRKRRNDARWDDVWMTDTELETLAGVGASISMAPQCAGPGMVPMAMVVCTQEGLKERFSRTQAQEDDVEQAGEASDDDSDDCWCARLRLVALVSCVTPELTTKTMMVLDKLPRQSLHVHSSSVTRLASAIQPPRSPEIGIAMAIQPPRAPGDDF